ncbi:type III secretion system FlhB-like substrate exporter [Desulfosalsimonas propionicica]|uniref:Type III secretion system FlhB-like substrate exporter n=1 Tax=Desulfosalsimonas propionicica TaxID=332175 RepID=A0A7W0HJP2_9BACT|nr:tetratricopeptide repeat protein [Desulfosalsimonas propionicica]MBA2880444.1 type III secretion system FlhB-like substrate exporter [Desulfosalsimonas propionicica]
MSIFRKLFLIVAFALVWLLGVQAAAQEILLDKMETCGDLICYPSLDSPERFYYLPDQPGLAYKNGRPQFSFLKYARTRKTGEAGTGQAAGGGILHFLVTYGASDERVRRAENDLRQRHPDAVLAGPIAYRNGSFALVTSFQQENQQTTRTVAVGKAPLMEGQKTAVSMALTRQGAELLWESFQSDTPDISLVFDMEFAGIRQPYEATLEADWKRVSKHDRIKAGFKYQWFGADVDILLQELRQTGAVKITTKGENKNMDQIIQSANEKLLKVMFDPAPADDLKKAAVQKNSYESLNQAVQLLKNAAGAKKSKKSAGIANPEAIYRLAGDLPASAAKPFWQSVYQSLFPSAYADTFRDRAKELYTKGCVHYSKEEYQQALETFRQALDFYVKNKDAEPQGKADLLFNVGMCLFKMEHYEPAIDPFNHAADLYGRDSVNGKAALGKIEKAKALAAAGSGDRPAASADSGGIDPEAAEQTAIEKDAGYAYNHARGLYEKARKANFKQAETQAALKAYEAYQKNQQLTGSRADEVNGRIRMLRQRLEKKADAAPTAASDEAQSAGRTAEEAAGIASGKLEDSSAGQTATTDASSKVGQQAAAGDKDKTGVDSRKEAAKKTAAQKNRASGAPGFSLVASYEMKRIKRSGKMVYEMNHFRTENQAFAMAENIGAIYARYGNDPRVFRAVTIDDPVFKQREVLVTLDGQDAATFTKYMNFVTVKMKKRHQAGDITTDEVVITPERFNDSGNHFSMAYGWKNDSDREAWLNYKYQAIWSFHGGVELRTPWKDTDSPMLALTPPHRYRTIAIEGDGSRLTKAGVRHGVITLKCRIGDHYVTRQATIRNKGPAPSMILDIPEDPDNPETRMAVTWYLTGSRKIPTAERKLEGDIIYWDELPGGGI